MPLPIRPVTSKDPQPAISNPEKPKRNLSPEFKANMGNKLALVKATEANKQENRQLTWKQRRFVAEYLADPGRNARAAAKRAGYKSEYDPSWLLTHPKIIPEIAAAEKRIFDKLEITAEAVVQHTAALAFSNLLDYIDEEGKIDFKKIGPLQGLAIQELSFENGKPRLKLSDKLAALNLLGKHFKVFEDSQQEGSRTQVSIQVFDRILRVGVAAR